MLPVIIIINRTWWIFPTAIAAFTGIIIHFYTDGTIVMTKANPLPPSHYGMSYGRYFFKVVQIGRAFQFVIHKFFLRFAWEMTADEQLFDLEIRKVTDHGCA